MSRIHRDQERKRIPMIGDIRVGEMGKSQKGKDMPVGLDYFKATGDYSEMFHKEFGDKPTSIEICFISDNTDDSCNERFEIRQGKKLYGYGDGRIFYVWNKSNEDYLKTDLSANSKEEIKSFMNKVEKQIDSKWSEILTLMFIIPRLPKVFGLWRFTTKGKDSSIPQIREAFDTISDITKSVRRIPFDLKVKKVVSQKPGSQNKFPVVQMIPNVSDGNLNKIRGFVESGIKYHGLLTEERIDSLEPPQIEDQAPAKGKIDTQVEKVKEKFQGQETTDADFETKVEPEPETGDFNKAVDLIKKSQKPFDVIQATKEIHSMRLTKDQLVKADKLANERLKVLKR